MKRFIPVATAAILAATIIGFNAAPAGIAQEAAAQDDAVRFIGLATQLAKERLSDNADRMARVVHIATNAVGYAAPGAAQEGFLGEIVVSQMAAMEQWPAVDRNTAMKAIASESAKLGGADAAASAASVRQAFAAMFMVAKDGGALYAAVGAVPANMRAVAADAIENAQSIVGGKKALKYKSLYAVILDALQQPSSGDFITDPTRVTITTTTTTSTTTTTTTTGFRLDGRVGGGASPVPPVVVPPRRPPTTTRPSPTPVGLF